MTPAQFRRLALALPDATEGSHMGHADFRVGGKVFATLGYPGPELGVVLLTPEDQAHLVKAFPAVFAPVRGAWGARGSTTVSLGRANPEAVRAALEAAWEARRDPPRRRGG